ncbi:MAG: universal stress protein, partial [Halobacteriales archaeon]|nr:universal stress protein [Halobacteriales archaeon]
MAARVLVPLDDSPHAWNALDHAIEKFADADIVVLHVNDPMEWIYTDDMGGYYSEDAFERAQESADELLSEAADRATAAGVDV